MALSLIKVLCNTLTSYTAKYFVVAVVVKLN